MTTLGLLVELRRQGVRFIIDGDRLRVIAPAGVKLSDTIRNAIHRHKIEILHRLRSGGIRAEDMCAIFLDAEVIETDVELGICARCGGQQWWVSRCGMKVCGYCFPPVTPRVVVAWLAAVRTERAV